MANQELHHYPEGESFAQHLGGANCPCKPRRTTTYRQNRIKQGHDVTVHYWHNLIAESTTQRSDS